VANAHIFGKVYFPRLAVPVSVVISNLIAFGIQLLLFLIVYIYYLNSINEIHPQPVLLLLPILILQMGILGLAFGVIVSAMTTRYRDLSHLVSFGVQLWMYATPVVYPASYVPGKWSWILVLNPMAPVIEAFRFAFLGAGSINLNSWSISLGVTFAALLIGLVLFNRVEKSFMDTV
jgi:lipopolysaccharide transport system permease protein